MFLCHLRGVKQPTSFEFSPFLIHKRALHRAVNVTPQATPGTVKAPADKTSQVTTETVKAQADKISKLPRVPAWAETGGVVSWSVSLYHYLFLTSCFSSLLCFSENVNKKQ